MKNPGNADRNYTNFDKGARFNFSRGPTGPDTKAASTTSGISARITEGVGAPGGAPTGDAAQVGSHFNTKPGFGEYTVMPKNESTRGAGKFGSPAAEPKAEGARLFGNFGTPGGNKEAMPSTRDAGEFGKPAPGLETGAEYSKNGTKRKFGDLEKTTDTKNRIGDAKNGEGEIKGNNGSNTRFTGKGMNWNWK